ncbi:hypothetical protein BGS_0503 [Beggiatoa sp. SS]|nr:hypothetical protein BGS_0503 [Beggiatoa sp. SS]
METLKQSALTAISQLPETATFNDIEAILEQLKSSRNAIKLEKEPISFLEATKEFIGRLEGPEDLSTNKDYMKAFDYSAWQQTLWQNKSVDELFEAAKRSE